MLEKILAGYAAEMGAVGVFALIAMKLTLDYLRAIKGAPSVCPMGRRDWEVVFKQINRLYEWHDKHDDTGRKLWYQNTDSHELAQALTRLAESTDANREAMQAIALAVELMSKDIEEIRKTL